MAGQTVRIGACLGWGAPIFLAVCLPAASPATRPTVVAPRAAEGLLNTAYFTGQEKAPTLKALRALLAEPVPPGGNRVLVSHSSTLADGTGIFPKQEGAFVVFRPDGRGGFRHVASFLPADLDALAKSPGRLLPHP
ncbi:MAG: phosphohistidine phosphatase SixA [Rhodocyclaceae bacterium]|nr:phosphohistidine phosphatase SixA [Rhodocyclaceae bacterium]